MANTRMIRARRQSEAIALYGVSVFAVKRYFPFWFFWRCPPWFFTCPGLFMRARWLF